MQKKKKKKWDSRRILASIVAGFLVLTFVLGALAPLLAQLFAN